MRKSLPLWLLCAGMTLSAQSADAKSRTFTAACMNVDGLPAKILVTINPDGPQEAGTEKISEMIASKGWDFFGVSEDFEFHSQLISKLDAYNVGKYRGTVTSKNTSAKNMADTDGLCFMWKKDIDVSGETMVPWTLKYGGITNGADECIDKGYRYYCVKFEDGFEVDVYTLHMNSGSDPGHLNARASQLNQLADAILASDNKRPIIIMGDTNCRWTRDPLSKNFFDKLNADPRFTANDPWVDFMWNGWHPTTGSSMMVGDLGNQKGEVVDKIFYINNTDAKGIHMTANGYLHDDSFIKEDGSPLADHFPIVIEFTIEDNYVAPEPGPETNTDAFASKQFYIRNVGTGEFLKAGGAWGTHAFTGEVGNRVTFIKGDNDGEYALRSTLGFISDPANFTKGSDFYMDAAAPRYFKISEIDKSGRYTITGIDENGKTIAFTRTDNDPMATVSGKELVSNSQNQLWEFISEEELISDLKKATEENPLNATFMIRGYDLGVNDSDNNSWILDAGSSVKQETWGPDGWDVKTWVYRVSNTKIFGTNAGEKGAWTVSQTVKGLPNGKYKLSCQMLTDYVPADGEANFIYSVNGKQVEGVKDAGKSGKIKADEAVTAFATGDYDLTNDVKVTDGTLDIKMSLGAHQSAAAVCFDNFKLMYYGEDKEDTSGVKEFTVANDTPVDVITLSGNVIRSNVRMANALDGLDAGIYILLAKANDGTTKAIKRIHK